MRRYTLPLIAVLIAVALGLGVGARLNGAVAEQALTPSQEEAVRRLVLDTIRKNPEIISEAVQILDQRRQAAEKERARGALAGNAELLFRDAETPVLGNPDGSVTLVEFSDYQCTYCKAMYPRLEKALAEDDDVRVVLKELPILGATSTVAAQAALAADRQGKYAEYHRALMVLRGRLTEDAVFTAAEDVGLDVARLKKDMEDPAILAKLAENRRLAQDLGISGTPAFVTADGVIPGAVDLETLRQVIAEQRPGG